MPVPLWSGLRLQVPGATSWLQFRAVCASPAAPLRQTETALIRQAVQDARGNVAEAARALGISRATVYRKLGSLRKFLNKRAPEPPVKAPAAYQNRAKSNLRRPSPQSHSASTTADSSTCSLTRTAPANRCLFGAKPTICTRIELRGHFVHLGAA